MFAGRRVSGYPREAPVYGQWRRNERAHVGQHDSRSPYIYGGHKHALSLKIFAGVMTGRQYLSGFVTFTSYQITPAWHGPHTTSPVHGCAVRLVRLLDVTRGQPSQPVSGRLGTRHPSNTTLQKFRYTGWAKNRGATDS